MDSTPTTHRSRRGRKAIEKYSSTPIRANLKDSATNRTSPTVSPMGRTNAAWLTPSTDNSDVERNEQLTRSALRRELHLDDEDDIMPCTQIVDPGANGEVFWNYNANPATRRAKAALKERLNKLEDNSPNEKTCTSSAPSPILTIPMLPTRRKLPSKSKEDNSVKEQQKRQEVNALLNSMKQIVQAELQKHQESQQYTGNQKMEVPQEMNNSFGKNNSFGTNNSFGKDGLVSDDDSFMLRASQAIGNSEQKVNCQRKITDNDKKDIIVENKEKETHNNEAFDDDDDFDILLTQIEMPNSDPSSSLKNKKSTLASNTFNNAKPEYPDPNSTRSIIKESRASVSENIKSTSNSSTLNTKLPNIQNKKVESINSDSKSLQPTESDSYFKRFKSASGISTVQQSFNGANNKQKTSSLNRRSFSTPDASSSSNQLPGGRDTSIKLSGTYKTDDKPKCTREEIEMKRLEAVKKREIERKRQEAIKRRQLNSQKPSRS